MLDVREQIWFNTAFGVGMGPNRFLRFLIWTRLVRDLRTPNLIQDPQSNRVNRSPECAMWNLVQNIICYFPPTLTFTVRKPIPFSNLIVETSKFRSRAFWWSVVFPHTQGVNNEGMLINQCLTPYGLLACLSHSRLCTIPQVNKTPV